MLEVTTETTVAPQTSEVMLFDVGSLMEVLHHVQDPRTARGVRYSLVSLLVLLILAKLSSQDEMKGMSEWVQLRSQKLAELLNLSRLSMPHQTTYERVLAQMDEDEVAYLLGRFFAQR